MKPSTNAGKDDLHPSLTTRELGVWTMISERKMQLNFAMPTINFVEMRRLKLQENVSVLYTFLKDCRKIFGIPLSCAYVSYQLLQGLEKTALLYAASEVMQTIEAGIVTQKPDASKLLRTIGLQLGIVVVTKTAQWAVQMLELSMESDLQRHFMLLQMQAMLRLDFPTFQKMSGGSGDMHSQRIWRAMHVVTQAFRSVVSTASQLWLIFNLTRHQEGSLLFAALCLARPAFTSFFGNIWSLLFVAHIANEDYRRSGSFYEMATKPDYKQEIVTGALDDYVTTGVYFCFCDSITSVCTFWLLDSIFRVQACCERFGRQIRRASLHSTQYP